MLDRVFSLLRAKNPNYDVRQRHVMPPPQLVRVGAKKTMWANFSQMSALYDLLFGGRTPFLSKITEPIVHIGLKDRNARDDVFDKLLPLNIVFILLFRSQDASPV